MYLFRARPQNKWQDQKLNQNLLKLDPRVFLRKWSIPRTLMYEILLRLKSLEAEVHFLRKKHS